MVLWIIAAFAAFFVKGLCGFANTLVFTSILAFGTDNINISPVELLLGYPASVIITWKGRKKLNRRIFIPLVLLVLAGSIPGAFLLKNTDARYIKIVFGIVIIFSGLEMLFRERRGSQTGGQKDGSKNDLLSGELREGSTEAGKTKRQRIILITIGLISGILCGLFGVGALLAAYVGRVTEGSEEFKTNINAVFIAENTFRIILYSALGIITLSGIRQVIILAPFMLAGLFAGIKSSDILDEKAAKGLVIILLILSGFAMIVKNS